jgi:hypothetical protein
LIQVAEHALAWSQICTSLAKLSPAPPISFRSTRTAIHANLKLLAKEGRNWSLRDVLEVEHGPNMNNRSGTSFSLFPHLRPRAGVVFALRQPALASRLRLPPAS